MKLPVRLVSVGFLSVLVLMFTITALAPHAYGFFLPLPTVSPNPIAGQPITIMGSVTGGTAGQSIYGTVFVDASVAHDCSSFGAGVLRFPTSGYQSLSAGLTYTFTVTLSSPGFYCAGVTDLGPPVTDSTGATPFSVTAATAPPIPEYPYGLPLLAILAIFAYGVIRRKTRN
ncbi:MAG: hypothetical protein ABSF63_15290 [Candidatus Bathyarchaeia archaeon]